jgi:hypothetical protein
MKEPSFYCCENCKEIVIETGGLYCSHCGAPVDYREKLEARTVIYKYPLPMKDETEICLPMGSQILTVQTQNNAPYIWALIETDAPLTTRRFCLRGTGHTFKGNEGKYIDTFQLENGGLVFHLFEERKK